MFTVYPTGSRKWKTGLTFKLFFSARNELGSLRSKVNAESPKEEKACTKNHATRFTVCNTAVLYDILVRCGRSYIGKTGRCVSDGLREDANTLKVRTGSNLSVHCTSCGCLPCLEDCAIMKDVDTREIYETFEIDARDDKCVRKPSVTLKGKEINYLKG